MRPKFLYQTGFSGSENLSVQVKFVSHFGVRQILLAQLVTKIGKFQQKIGYNSAYTGDATSILVLNGVFEVGELNYASNVFF